MRVLINALSARQRGGQTYLRNLLAHLPKDGSIDVLLLAPESLELDFEHGCIVRFPVRRYLENPFARALWEKLVLPRVARDYGADVLFCPGGVVSCAPSGCRIVTMFRNMIPFDDRQRNRYPLGYDRLRHWLLHRVMLKSMLRADLVIFISRYARQVIERHTRRALSGVVIPHGVPSRFRESAVSAPHVPAALIDDGYLLYVSYIDFYKAQLEVVRAYSELRGRRGTAPKLVLVGPENAAYGAQVRECVTRLGLDRHVIITGAIAYQELPAWYQNATINIFASESENCPNILLEALAAGRPVVSSERPPMPEFAGDAVLYFDPASPSDLAGKLEMLLDDPVRMEVFARRAAEQSKLYDWGDTARRTWEAIASVVRGDIRGVAASRVRLGEEY
jgi:glycosyltransferase involved in cell wall biosynthesis